MPKSTAFEGIETAYPVLTNVPAAAELHIVADGEDYNITPVQIVRGVLGSLSTQIDTELGSTIWRLGGEGGGGFVLLDEDDFASNSAIAAPSQQSTKAYVDAAIAAVPGNDAISNAELANVATSTIKGRATAGTGDPEDLTAAQVRTILNVQDGATDDQTGSEIITLLEAAASLSAAALDDLEGSTAGGRVSEAIIVNSTAAAGEGLVVNSTEDGFDPVAFEPLNPTPGTASSSAGAITLDFSTTDTIQTTTTEAITTITVTGLAIGAKGLWKQIHTTARNTTFPSTWWVPAASNPTHTASANTRQSFLITRYSSTVYEVDIGTAKTVV